MLSKEFIKDTIFSLNLRIQLKGNKEQFLSSMLSTEKRVTKNTKGGIKTFRRSAVHSDNRFLFQSKIF